MKTINENSKRQELKKRYDSGDPLIHTRKIKSYRKDGSYIELTHYYETKAERKQYESTHYFAFPDNWEKTIDNVKYKKVPNFKAIATDSGFVYSTYDIDPNNFDVSKLVPFKESKSNEYGYIKHSIAPDNVNDESVNTSRQRIIAYTFGLLKSLKYDGTDINHINTKPGDDRLENLEVCSHRDNCLYRDHTTDRAIKRISDDGTVKIYRNCKTAAKELVESGKATSVNTVVVYLCKTLREDKPGIKNQNHRAYGYAWYYVE